MHPIYREHLAPGRRLSSTYSDRGGFIWLQLKNRDTRTLSAHENPPYCPLPLGLTFLVRAHEPFFVGICGGTATKVWRRAETPKAAINSMTLPSQERGTRDLARGERHKEIAFDLVVMKIGGDEAKFVCRQVVVLLTRLSDYLGAADHSESGGQG